MEFKNMFPDWRELLSLHVEGVNFLFAVPSGREQNPTDHPPQQDPSKAATGNKLPSVEQHEGTQRKLCSVKAVAEGSVTEITQGPLCCRDLPPNSTAGHASNSRSHKTSHNTRPAQCASHATNLPESEQGIKPDGHLYHHQHQQQHRQQQQPPPQYLLQQRPWQPSMEQPTLSPPSEQNHFYSTHGAMPHAISSLKPAAPLKPLGPYELGKQAAELRGSGVHDGLGHLALRSEPKLAFALLDKEHESERRHLEQQQLLTRKRAQSAWQAVLDEHHEARPPSAHTLNMPGPAKASSVALPTEDLTMDDEPISTRSTRFPRKAKQSALTAIHAWSKTNSDGTFLQGLDPVGSSGFQHQPSSDIHMATHEPQPGSLTSAAPVSQFLLRSGAPQSWLVPQETPQWILDWVEPSPNPPPSQQPLQNLAASNSLMQSPSGSPRHASYHSPPASSHACTSLAQQQWQPPPQGQQQQQQQRWPPPQEQQQQRPLQQQHGMLRSAAPAVSQALRTQATPPVLTTSFDFLIYLNNRQDKQVEDLKGFFASRPDLDAMSRCDLLTQQKDKHMQQWETVKNHPRFNLLIQQELQVKSDLANNTLGQRQQEGRMNALASLQAARTALEIVQSEQGQEGLNAPHMRTHNFMQQAGSQLPSEQLPRKRRNRQSGEGQSDDESQQLDQHELPSVSPHFEYHQQQHLPSDSYSHNQQQQQQPRQQQQQQPWVNDSSRQNVLMSLQKQLHMQKHEQNFLSWKERQSNLSPSLLNRASNVVPAEPSRTQALPAGSESQELPGREDGGHEAQQNIRQGYDADTRADSTNPMDAAMDTLLPIAQLDTRMPDANESEEGCRQMRGAPL